MAQIGSKKFEELDELGFTLVPGAISAVEVNALVSELERAIREDVEDLKRRGHANPESHVDYYMVHNAMLRGRSLVRLLEHSLMHEFFNHYLGDTCVLYSYQTSSLPAQGTNYTNRVHVDCPRMIPNYLTNLGALFALDDFSDENGATYFLPGSHKSDRQPTEDEFRENAVRPNLNQTFYL